MFDCRGLQQFLHGVCLPDPVKNGRAEAPGQRWKAKERENKYSYRYDAAKFCRQLFIPEHAASLLPDGDILAWMDADVYAFKPVPVDLPERLLGGKFLGYLGRENTSKGYRHPEIGFWVVELNQQTRRFLHALADIYRTGKVFELQEWHSAFVFDHVRKATLSVEATHNITPDGEGHVWFQNDLLASCLDHCKGSRKAVGHSPESRTKWWENGA